jgi:hypothetical protein
MEIKEEKSENIYEDKEPNYDEENEEERDVSDDLLYREEQNEKNDKKDYSIKKQKIDEENNDYRGSEIKISKLIKKGQKKIFQQKKL